MPVSWSAASTRPNSTRRTASPSSCRSSICSVDFWPHGAVAHRTGVLNQHTGGPQRVSFLLDGALRIRHRITSEDDEDARLGEPDLGSCCARCEGRSSRPIPAAPDAASVAESAAISSPESLLDGQDRPRRPWVEGAWGSAPSSLSFRVSVGCHRARLSFLAGDETLHGWTLWTAPSWRR